MKLLKFRVTNFRSVEDSGWIEVEDTTALIGTNEAGKTNLLIPLWKLNPVRNGEINPVSDYPRKRYNEIKNMEDKPVFIRAEFELEDELAEEIAELTGARIEDVKIAQVSRDFDDIRRIRFPSASAVRSVEMTSLVQALESGRRDVESAEPAKNAEGELKERLLEALAEAEEIAAKADGAADANVLKKIEGLLEDVDVSQASSRSTMSPRFGKVKESVRNMLAEVSRPAPSQVKGVQQLVLQRMPDFVYYANYGNLDSEIYLPHVIDNMNRGDLGSREEAKTRTLRVLFEFVKLSPQEILELGQELPLTPESPTQQQIEAAAERKKERTILMQSASTELTGKFRDWWRQGDYVLNFQADGNHFRIWVSDNRRPEQIELEGRSAGLQWFLSFFLVFLVESTGEHEGSILLLDEPGLSLHPIAQNDLSEFFKNLAKTNQIIYTAHSPFMVDADQLERVKAVYVDERGATAVSADLRAPESSKERRRSVYPVHAALGLTVSETLLYGCQPVIVEGQSDQIYLNAIKNYLIGKGRIKPRRELVFIPSGGVKGVTALTSLITGTNEELPHALLDSDRAGRDMANNLKSKLYSSAPARVLMVGDFLNGMADAEIEDLFPVDFLSRIMSRDLRPLDTDEYFEDVAEPGRPIVSQAEEYAERHDLKLDLGWKVEAAKKSKTRLLADRDPMSKEQGVVDGWESLFSKLMGSA